MLAAAAAVSIAVTGVAASGIAAPAAQAADLDPAVLEITKSVEVRGQDYDLPDAPEVEVGEEFKWQFEVICQQITDQCVDATFTDVIPDEFEINVDSINVPPFASVAVDGQTVNITFTQTLNKPSGRVGLITDATFTIPVKLRPIAQERNGEVLTNVGSTRAENAPEVTDDAAVTAVVPLILAASAEKAFSPDVALAQPDGTIDLTFSGTNASNGAVDRLVVQDPIDPTASPNVFQQYLQIDSLGTVAWPTGAEQATLTVHDGSGWVDADPVTAGATLVLPAGFDPADARGVRIAFTATNPTIPAGAVTSVQLALSQRDAVSALTSDTVVPNTVQAVTGAGGDESAPGTNTANLTLRPAATSVLASKLFDPDEISVVGPTDFSIVRLGAENTGTFPLTSLTINEPSNPADLTATNIMAPAFGDGAVVFAGLESGVVWPTGATAASIVYYFADGTSETVSTTTVDTLPAPEGPGRVTGFAVTFTGLIVESAEAAIPFRVDAPESMTAREITGTNEITVTGTTEDGLPDPAPDVADDALTILNEQITITTTKRLTHRELWSIPGQTTTAMLETTIADYPRTTKNPTQVIIDDPSATTGITEWYEHFDATAITLTQIPANATLTVQYRNATGSFADIPGMVDISGATDGIFSAPIPASLHSDIVGVRFIYSSNDGFAPGQTLSPNVTFTTRATERTSNAPIPSVNPDPTDTTPIAELENCSASEASNAAEELDSGRVTVADPCPQTDLLPRPPGVGPDIEKEWAPDLVFSHSRQNTTVNLLWTTGGVQGIDEIVISDVSTTGKGNPGPVATGSFDAFNLTRVGPINDPGFAYDELRVQLFNGTAWVDAAACTDAAPCTGASIPAIPLTADEQQSTTAVRFLVTEGSRTNVTDPSAPLPGTGVSTGGNRSIPLQLQLRDTLRSTGNPVVEGPLYNTAEASEVFNTASLDGYVDSVATYRDSDGDTILVTDPDLGVTTTKTWDGSPVAIPQSFATDTIPTTRVTLATTNTTAGGVIDGQAVPGRVSSLTIAEPGAHPGDSPETPFDAFDLIRIQDLKAPAGTTEVRIAFTGTGTPAPVIQATAATALAEAQGLPLAQLRNVIGVVVTFTGNIASGAPNGTGQIVLDLELREHLRGTSTDVTVANSPVENTVLGTVADTRWDGTTFVDEILSDDHEAQVVLEAQDISVQATKTFAPATQTEPAQTPITMTIGGTPRGSERAKELVLTDDRATFWNAYDYVQVADSLALPTFSPAGHPTLVQFSVCTGRDFAAWAEAATIVAEAGCVATGGSWSDWSTAMSAADARAWEPADGTDVQGIRVRITRYQDVQWENPKSPHVQIPLMVQRRDDLRTGGPVPSTLKDGGSPAPGESVKGAATNGVTADVAGIWGGRNTHATTAVVTYRHTNNAVQVLKDPIGVKAPGALFPYTLTVTNTGDRDIVDPVITDRLPWNAELGTLVQFDPEAPESEVRYGYALSGTNPTEGSPMPTDAAEVTVAEDLGSNTPTIGFTFPDGTRLAPGQTYTITFSMMFVPGVVEGLPVINGFDVTGDRVWDSCTAPTGRTATLSSDEMLCATTAQVTPDRLPSLRSIKAVRAVADGSFNNHGFQDADVCATRVDAEGFAVQPCVPLTAPGQTEQWRLSVTNNGTTPIETLVVADVLPTPGDTTLIAEFPRNSQWTPVLLDTEPSLAAGANTNTLRSFVTTAPQDAVCLRGVRSPAEALACIDETGADPGTKFVPFDLLADHSAATALLFLVDPPTGQKIDPGAEIAIDFETKTPGSSQQIAANPQAFNSLTVSAIYLDGNVQKVMSARDQSKVGVGLITGSIQIEKEITGPGAGFVPDDLVFAGSVVCVSDGQDVPPRDFTVVAGTPTVVENLPFGAECTVTETSASGQTSYTATTVVVPEGAPAQLPAIEITNTYELTELVVSKQVVTDAAQYPTDFGFEVACTFLGEELELAPADASFVLDHGESRTITGLPVNAECVVTETDDADADSTTVEAESLDAEGEPWGSVTEDGATATITGLAPASGTNAAAFTNTYGASAAVRIEKDLTGGAADLADSLTFEIAVSCTFDGEELFGDVIELNRGNGWGQTLPSLVAGTECVVTEADLRGADAVVITPNDGTTTTTGVVTVPADSTEPVVVTVENRFLAGSLEVTKQVTGDGAELYGTGDFEVQLVCTLAGEPVRVIGGADRVVSATSPVAEYTGLPSGAECTLTETEAAGATASQMQLAGGDWVNVADGITFVVVVDAAIASNDDQAQTPITVENRFDLAEVSITKTIVSDAVDSDGDPLEYGPFEVELVCTFEGAPIEVADAVQQIVEGQTVTWTGLPAGADCVVTETDSADAVETWYEQGDELDPIVTEGLELEFANLAALGTDRSNEAVLRNAFDSADLTVTKVINGDDAASAAGFVFEVHLACTLTDATRPDGEIVREETLMLSADNGWRVTVAGLASGAECSVTETVTRDADETVIAVDGERIGATTGAFVSSTEDAAVTVTNTFRKDLATTGASTGGIAALVALLLLLGGGGALMVLRRRRAGQ